MIIVTPALHVQRCLRQSPFVWVCKQVTVGFAATVLGQGPGAQAEQLRKLAAALDRIGHVELAGVHVMLGRDYGVDPLGRLWLDVDDTALFWSG